MKQNKVIKYSLIIVSLILTLMTDTIVYAEGGGSGSGFNSIKCEYHISGTYTKFETVDAVSGEIQKKEYPYDYNLALVKSGDVWKLSGGGTSGVFDNFTFDSKKDWLKFGDGTTCPTITVYRRMDPNDFRFYVLNSEFNKQCQQKMNDNPKKANYIKLDGYTCSRIVGSYSGSKVDSSSGSGQTCSTEQIKAAKNKRVELFEQNVTAKYNEIQKQLERAAIVFQTSHDISVCNAYMNVSDDCLSGSFDTFSQQYKNYLSTLNCESTELQGTKMESEMRLLNTTTNSYGKKLVDYRYKMKNECTRTANATQAEKTNSYQDAEEERDETYEAIVSSNNESFEEAVELISNLNLGGEVDISCEGIFGSDLLDLIGEILNYVQIGAPIILIVLGTIDFAQAVLTDDKDAIKKAASKFAKRAIACIIIFFLPLIINIILGAIEGVTTDPTCGIR